ncbi:MAG: response regulator [Syntrophobacteraceae bacterium]
MKVLLLAPYKALKEKSGDFERALEAIEARMTEEPKVPNESSGIDVVVGGGTPENHAEWVDALLAWRTHPHTSLVPCCIVADAGFFAKCCLWPHLSSDLVEPELTPSHACDWLASVAAWQHNRMEFSRAGSLRERSPLEIAASLALRKATGRLSIFDDDGEEGFLLTSDGRLSGASVKNLRGAEAFFDFLSWNRGSCHWEERDPGAPHFKPISLYDLTSSGLKLIREGNLLFHFISDIERPIARTDSESALDDGAIPFFAEQRAIYGLIDGRTSPLGLMAASPLSRPRTMGILAKWFSLGDIRAPDEAKRERAQTVPLRAEAAPAPDAKQYRVLIVDDSMLMCNALKRIFSSDARFEVVGCAHDGIEALELIQQSNPDVITLDMQMPRMDGLTTLKHIMVRGPKPVVVLSAFTKETSLLTYEAFKYGAVDVLTKPVQGPGPEMAIQEENVRDRVAQAFQVRMEAAQYIRRKKTGRGARLKQGENPGDPTPEGDPAGCVAAAYCGAGGFPSMLKFLFGLSQMEHFPAVIVCTAMPPYVLDALLPNIQKDCGENGLKIERLKPGSPANCNSCGVYSHEERLIFGEDGMMEQDAFEGDGAEGPFDRLLSSAVRAFGGKVVAMVLSGSEEDAVHGIQEVRNAGGRAYALSRDLCLRPELPDRLLHDGAATEVRSVSELPRILKESLTSFRLSTVAG